MRFTSFAAVGALAALTNAQTWTECNPTEKECPNDPAMPETFNTDFRAGADNVKGWKQTAGSLTYNQEGAQFTINKQGESPTIQSEGYLHFGYVEVKCKAASGTGIISSIVIQSESLDEVDWEFLGSVPNTVQTNYFGKGNTTTYDRMIEVPVMATQTQMHTYAVDWTAERIIFLIDGTPVRTLNYADANGGNNFPQTPSTVRIGIWAGGDPNNAPGVIEWAGGKTDYTKAPFTMTVESISVKNYSPGKEYKWTDRSGSWESIEVIGEGDVEGSPVNSVPIEPTPSATGTEGGLASDINVPEAGVPTPIVPTGTGAYPIGTGGPQVSTTCLEQPPYPTGGNQNGTVPHQPSPPAGEVPTTLISTTGSYGVVQPPPSGSYAPEVPPYPTGGIQTDTASSPMAAFPTGSALPTGSGSPVGPGPVNPSAPAPAPSAPAEFEGAASSHKAGALVVLVAAAAFLV